MNTIRRYGNVAEAGFAQSLLVAEGIDAVLADEYAGALGPQFVPWGMRLQVPEEDVARALEILDRPAVPESEMPDFAQDGALPMEHEAPSPDRAEATGRTLTCPHCGTEWELTEQEMELPVFTCTECGTGIPHEVPGRPSRKFDWRCFLPRSESKWVFVLVMVAYIHGSSMDRCRTRQSITGTDPAASNIIGWAHRWSLMKQARSLCPDLGNSAPSRDH